MRLLDLSQPLYHGAPNCPVHPPVVFKTTFDHLETGWRMEEIAMATHTGSHLDAPLHKIAGGASIDQLPLEGFAGPALIADLRGLPAGAAIGPEALAEKLSGDLEGKIILLATGWGQRRAMTREWLYQSPYLHPEAAHWLVSQGIRGIGIDHFSIGGMTDENAATHTILLTAGVWILEELCFPAESFQLPQPVKLWALPLNWPGCSGAFCRPVIELSWPAGPVS